jgi:hypothetical protein
MTTKENAASPSTVYLTDKDETIKKAWEAYNGRMPDPIVTSGRTRVNDNVKGNLCRTVVDKGMSFLFGDDAVKFTLDNDEDEESPQEVWLAAVWKANRKQKLLNQLALNGAVSGHAFLKIVLKDDYPRLVALDSSKIEVCTADDDFEKVNKYTITWLGNYEGKKAAYRQVITRGFFSNNEDEVAIVLSMEEPPAKFWMITDQVTTANINGYIGQISDDQWDTLQQEVWPWEFAPIIDCQNLTNSTGFWGLSDLEPDVIHVQHAINRTLTNINKILRLHAHPKTYAKGMTQSQLSELAVNPEGVIAIPNLEGGLYNLEMTSDLESSVTYYNRLRELFHEITRVPEVATGRMENVGQLSGTALKILYGPLVEKTDTKRDLYGELLKETCRRLLIIYFGYPESANTELERIPGEFQAISLDEWGVTLVWKDMIPTDPLTEVQVAVQAQQLGVSKRTLLKKLGYDPDEEAVQAKAEAAQALEDQQQQMMVASRGQAGLDPFGRDKSTDSNPAA